VNWLLDSNILIDYLNGMAPAAEVLGKAEATSISRVSWIEVLAGAESPEQASALRGWLARFTIVEIDATNAERAMELRRKHRLSMPDPLIWASAQVHGLILVSRNTRDFPSDQPGIHVPYRIEQPRRDPRPCKHSNQAVLPSGN